MKSRKYDKSRNYDLKCQIMRKSQNYDKLMTYIELIN